MVVALLVLATWLRAGAQTVTEFRVLTPGSSPLRIAPGSDGNLWFTEFFANAIGQITPAGEITEFMITAGRGQPVAITAGPDGNVWYTSLPTGRPATVGRVTPDGVITEFPLPGAVVPLGITTGPDGNLWFTQLGFVDQIGRITPDGGLTDFPLPWSNSATGITAGADGNLWFTGQTNNKIGRITPTGVFSEFPVPTPGGRPFGITAGPDGNVWFTWMLVNGYGNKVSRITPDGVITEFPLPPTFAVADQITAGPDGNLWLTDHGNGGIACVTVDGVICDIVQPPTSGSGLDGITTGPDGNIWFVEQIGNKIGRFNPAEAAEIASVQFSADRYTVSEDSVFAMVTVTRTGRLWVPFTVPFAVTALTAVADRDFAPVAGELGFPAFTTTGTFLVRIFGNRLVTGDRTVALTLGTPDGEAVLGAFGTATLTIRDLDRPGTFQLDATTYRVEEGAGSLVVTISRSGAHLGGDVSVDFATSDGAGGQGAVAGRNYAALSGRLTFGADETTKTVSIPILVDGVVTGPLRFGFALSNPTSGATLALPSAATITISDTDRGGTSEFSLAAHRVSQAAGEIRIPIVRRDGAARDVVLAYETKDGSARAGRDYGRGAGSVTFGMNESTAFITLPVVDHRQRTGDRAFTVVLTRAGGGGTLGSRKQTSVTIADDHAVLELSGRAARNDLEVVRTGSLTAHVTVHYRAIDGTAVRGLDYDVGDGILVFPPGARSAYIPVRVVDDNIAEGRETFRIELFDPSPPAILGRVSSLVFGIGDNDFGGTVSFSRASSTAPLGSRQTITITRQGGLGTILTVSWRAMGGSAVATRDFGPASGSVTFGPQDTSQTFTVDVADPDVSVVPDRTVVFGLSFPAGAARLGGVSTSTVRIPGRGGGASVGK